MASLSSQKKFPYKLVFVGVVLLGIILRYSLLPYGDFNINGDLDAVGEWGTRFSQLETKNFYSDTGWYYTSPTYPPLSSLMYGFLGWLFNQKYILSLVHNKIKIPPSSFIIDFYASGYNLVLKLPTILADFGLGILIYKIVDKLTKNKKKATLATAFYLLNPITLFLSGVWGQTESLIAFFGVLSFITLLYKKAWISIPLFFISIYIKPTWSVFIPLYVFLLWYFRPKLLQVLVGIFLSAIIFYVTTKPFGGSDLIGFTYRYIVGRVLPGSKGASRASISAFNFWTIFMKIDRDFDTAKFLLLPAKWWGVVVYIFLNLFSFSYIKKEKNKLLGVIVGIFVIGMGSFLFLTSILERYFFAAFTPLVILIFARPKLTFYLVTMNIILFLNLIWAFYRRTSNEIDHPFTNNNFFLMRILSLVVTSFYLVSIKLLKGFKYKLNV